MSQKRSGQVSGPLAEFEGGYRAVLVGLGYKPRTVRTLVALTGRLSVWMEADGRSVGELSSEMAEQFLVETNSEGRVFQPTSATLDSLLAYLRRIDAAPVEDVPPPDTGDGATVAAFRFYLLNERGLVPETADYYARSAGVFLAWQQRHGLADLALLGARDVVGFVTAECPVRSTGTAKLMLTGLRSFLRFAHLEGLVAESLVGAVPSVAGWSAAGLPRGLAPGEVKALLASCDRRRVKGRRDYAILLLLVRFGLRAAEVAVLSLDDVDWRSGELVIRGKGRHDERLPLPGDVGEAVAGYLHRGRPTSSSRSLFLRVHAPIGGLQASGISEIVRDRCRRAGVSVVGSHRLRHTAATEMLRSGATMPEVAQVLRHRSTATTAIYAKVDHRALRELAVAWPTGGAQ